MEETRSTRLSRADVQAALMWAIEHDHVALLAHRSVAHTYPSEFTRRRADAALVQRWLDATGGRGAAPAS
ncbi:hypothetical protein [Antribacter gilvus]|uniref:hypothetical protein n=1 Tax=Antribacter gilvus TaxID=2304675 RepID=UPI000F76874C|nr:hypothetical protein [Antribacter gilvus]